MSVMMTMARAMVVSGPRGNLLIKEAKQFCQNILWLLHNARFQHLFLLGCVRLLLVHLGVQRRLASFLGP